MDGERGEPLFAADRHARERVARDADDASIRSRDGHERARRVVAEPPVELGTAHRRFSPGVTQQPQVVVPLRGLVPGELVGHRYFDEVPSAALKSRRACVPVTVSFSEIRSHAPESTSSNVRSG